MGHSWVLSVPAGSVAIARMELAAYRAARVGMVFQAFNLLPQYSALANVEMALLFSMGKLELRLLEKNGEPR